MYFILIPARKQLVSILLSGLVVSSWLWLSSIPVSAQARPQPTSSSQSAPAAPRSRLNINQKWKFVAADTPGAEDPGLNDSNWSTIDLPHTWNAEDAFDDDPGYRMDVGWYRKILNLDARLKDKQLFLYFEGANQVADVFVNGQFAGRHAGGYTAFVFDISSLVRFDSAGNRNLIAVKVDNRPNENLPPSTKADFNLYGGIYRDVWLVATNMVHFTVNDHASPGIFIDTKFSNNDATLRARGTIANGGAQPRQLRVRSSLVDASGQFITAMESPLQIGAGGEVRFEQTREIREPRLWSPETPYLYLLRSQILDGTTVLDQMDIPVGFRWFSFDPDKGFILNGRPYRLRGVNRHQDYYGMGNAVPNELHVEDLRKIKAMGLNCVLLAHYPQDPAILDAADRLGLLVWEEIPLVREISTSPEYAHNSKLMLTEMIRQHYNHPSIIIWCLMNEIFLRMRSEPGYVKKVVDLARDLDALARREDPTRVTAIAANRPYDNSDIYNASGLLNIPEVVGWHMYFGWYYEDFAGLGKFLDVEHQRFPRRNLFVSEYGADSDVRIHSLNPRRGDLSTEWAQLYHLSYIQQIEARPYLAGSAVWALNDFGAEARGESKPHVNTKGLLTFDRRPKDISYLYQATFSNTPVLHIATDDWQQRTGVEVQPFEVYTNLPTVELIVNQKSQGMKQVDHQRAVWNVVLNDGPNLIEARGHRAGRTLIDRAEVRFRSRPIKLAATRKPFRELAVNVGSTSQYLDAHGRIWEADQRYAPGEWGYEGGSTTSTNRNILGSPDDPLFQTMRQGLTAYRFDVPDGSYEVELRLVEPYFDEPGKRVFAVLLNGRLVLEKVDLVKNYGAAVARSQTFPVHATRKQGVTIHFQASSGEAVLSAIRISRRVRTRL
jgi:beta-galactosidase